MNITSIFRKAFKPGFRLTFGLLGCCLICAFTPGVSAEQSITIVYGADYEPFSWGVNGAPFGVQRDFVDEVLVRQMGLQVHHEACPWSRCQALVKLGEKDGFFTVPTEERKRYALASSLPFYETHFVMHSSKENPNLEKISQVESLRDLEALPEISHIHMLGSGWHENALQKMTNVQTIVDASKIPLLLAYQRADLYIEQAEMFRYQAKQAGVLDQLITFYPPSIRKLGWHLFIGNNSKHQVLMRGINAKLQELKDTGELDRIRLALFKKYGIE